jgi:hypothetical protein
MTAAADCGGGALGWCAAVCGGGGVRWSRSSGLV